MAEVTLYGTAAPGTSRDVANIADATDVEYGSAFDIGATGQTIIGARVYVPDGSSAIGQEIVLGVYAPAVADTALPGTPTRVALVEAAVVGWNRADFAIPLDVAAGARVLVTYRTAYSNPAMLNYNGASSSAVPTTGGEYALSTQPATGKTPSTRSVVAFLDSGTDWLTSPETNPVSVDMVVEVGAAVPELAATAAATPTVTVAGALEVRTQPRPGPARAVPAPSTTTMTEVDVLGLPSGRIEHRTFTVSTPAVGVEVTGIRIPFDAIVRSVSISHRMGSTSAAVTVDVTADMIPLTVSALSTTGGYRVASATTRLTAGQMLGATINSVTGTPLDLVVTVTMEVLPA